MTELEPSARLMVQLARRGDAPEKTDRDRVRAALAAALARDSMAPDGPGPRLDDALVTRGERSISRRERPRRVPNWLWVAALMATTATAAAGTVTLTMVRWGGSSPAPARSVERPPSEAAPGPVGGRPAERAGVAEIPSPPTRAAASAPVVGRASGAGALPVVPSAVVPPAPSRRLAEEAALLRQARNALAAGRLDAADLALAEHRTRMPHGALAEDREALRAVLACRRGDGSEAAAGFARHWPDSPLTTRVTVECGAQPQ